jgi:hypothetical protein
MRPVLCQRLACGDDGGFVAGHFARKAEKNR